jgi:hypothetical protein
MIEAAPAAIAGMCNQSSFHGIAMDVTAPHKKQTHLWLSRDLRYPTLATTTKTSRAWGTQRFIRRGPVAI